MSQYYETDFNNDGFFQRKQIQIDMFCWPRPHHYIEVVMQKLKKD